MTLALLHPGQRDHALRMARALIRHHQRPDLTVHSSWLPADWPAAYRRPHRLGQRGGEVLAGVLQRAGPAAIGFDADFSTPIKRLGLLDGPALRRLGWYCGAALHRDALDERPLRRQLLRQSRRFGPDAEAYVLDRLPRLSAVQADLDALRARPASSGRTVWIRGLRVLLALLAGDGDHEAGLAAVWRKLPRQLAGLRLPRLQPKQRLQMEEAVMLNIVPERLPQWDWLF